MKKPYDSNVIGDMCHTQTTNFSWNNYVPFVHIFVFLTTRLDNGYMNIFLHSYIPIGIILDILDL